MTQAPPELPDPAGDLAGEVAPDPLDDLAAKPSACAHVSKIVVPGRPRAVSSRLPQNAPPRATLRSRTRTRSNSGHGLRARTFHQRPRHRPGGRGQTCRRPRLPHVLRARAHPHPDQARGRAPHDGRRVPARRPLHAHAGPVGQPRHRGRGDLAGAAVHRRRTARRTRPDHPGQVHRHARPPLGWTGQRGRRIRLEHRRTRRPQRAAGPPPHDAAGVPRGHAGAVDPGGGLLRRRVREVRSELGVAQARAIPHPDPRRRGRHGEELQVDRHGAPTAGSPRRATSTSTHR